MFSIRTRYLLPGSILVGLFCVFVLPFLFPPSHPVLSQSYSIGYNNRVAQISLALISVLVALLSFRGNASGMQRSTNAGGVTWPWLVAALVLVTAWNGGLSWLVYSAHNYGVEDFYILPQVEKYYYLHRHLYRDIEFCYGQLLFYGPILVHWLLTPFHVSLTASYYVALVLHHLLGVSMLYFVVNGLPMPRYLRVTALVCITLFSFNPSLGPNYTLLRYMLPIVSFILFSRVERPGMAAAVGAVAQYLMWLDSPEQAIGFGFAVAVYCGYQFWLQRDLQWIWPLAGVAISTVVYFSVVDPSVLSAFSHVSHGAGNLVPQISFEVLTLVIAVVWLVPRLIVSHLRSGAPDSGMLLGLYALGLGLLPASLGSCDIVHVTGNSAVLFLLSIVAAGEQKVAVRWLWTTAVAATYLLMVAQWLLKTHRIFNNDVACVDERVTPLASRLPAGLASRLLTVEHRWPCSEPTLDVATLHAAIGDAPFAAPFPLPEIVEEKLPRLPNFVPSRWSGTIDLWDVDLEQGKVDELRHVQWALLGGPPGGSLIEPNLSWRFTIHTHYRVKHPEVLNGLVAAEINENWVPAGRIGDYFLYRRVR